jgi:hypothetical protein
MDFQYAVPGFVLTVSPTFCIVCGCSNEWFAKIVSWTLSPPFSCVNRDVFRGTTDLTARARPRGSVVAVE